MRSLSKSTKEADKYVTARLNDISACQHVLRIIMDISDLIVREVRPQRMQKLMTEAILQG